MSFSFARHWLNTKALRRKSGERAHLALRATTILLIENTNKQQIDSREQGKDDVPNQRLTHGYVIRHSSRDTD